MKITRKRYDKVDMLSIQAELNKVKWENLLSHEDVDINWSIFQEKVSEIEKKHVPVKTFSYSQANKNKFPLDKQTIQMIKEKHRLYRQAGKNADPIAKREYSKVRNKVRKLTHQARK